MADQDEAVLKSGSSDGSPAGPPPPSPWISPANVGEGHDNGNPMLGELIPHMQDLKKRVSPQAGQLLDKLSGRIASATPQQPTTPQAKPFDPSTLPLVASAKPAASIGAMAAPPNITTMIPGASPLPQQLQGMADVPGRDTAPLTARNRAQDLENAPYHSGMMEKADAVQNPFLRGLAKTGATVADVIASGVFPKFGQFVPGTTAHHDLLQGLAEHGANQEQAREAEDQKLSEGPLNREKTEAEIAHEKAQTDTLNSATVDPETQAFEAAMKANGGDAEKAYGSIESAKAGTKAAAVHYTNLPDGSIVAITPDAKGGTPKAEVVYKGNPKVETEVTKLEVNGKPHTVIVDKRTGATVKDLGESGEKPPTVNLNQGSWQIAEGADGKPVLFNSKTAETKAAPNGVEKSGTHDKQAAAQEKLIGPARDAQQFADDYLKSGVFTGPKDEALMEKFFELAKPSSGFRMSQQQIDMLKNARSWMGSVEAKARHAISGTWFSDDQRNQIAGAMKSLADAKMKGHQQTPTAETGNQQQEPVDPTLKAYADQYFGGDIQKAKAHNVQK